MTDIRDLEPLWGAWYIDKQLGEGSYGKVFKVHKKEFNKTYEAAVKIISIPQKESDIVDAQNEGLNEESARSYFQAFVTDIIQEVDLMKAFQGNSNIVSIEDHKVIEKKNGIGWDIIIRMELLETLSSYITKKPMTQAEIIKLGIDICRALEICARNNTIHRDIKPDNIFVSQYGDYKLGDFGIARQIERTMSGLSVKGTHQYMAPEVFKGMEYGASVDIYSLGIVMYRFLNKNRAPFMPDYPKPIMPGDRDDSLQRRMKGETIPEINGIIEELNSIVLKACTYKREERFASASEMREALESINTHNPELYVPIIEISGEHNDNDDEDSEYPEYSLSAFNPRTSGSIDEGTYGIFSRKAVAPPEEQPLPEPVIQVPDSIIKNISIFSSVFWILLAGLSFFSGSIKDTLIFLPLYMFCIAQCFWKFRNKTLNYIFIAYLGSYLLLSILINFRIFDYSFMIFTLCLLSLIASCEKKFQLIDCIVRIICAVTLGILVLHISRNTHYVYVSGTIAIPFLIFLSSPTAFLLGNLGSRRVYFGIALLIMLQFFTLVIFIIYSTGLINNSQLLYHIINANFPGFSPERFSWWTYGRFTGIIINLFAFISLLMLAMTTIKPKLFLYCIKNKNRK